MSSPAVPAKPCVVAIDGPAGAGKSTVARSLAERLGYVLLDTGALYRAVALAGQRASVAWDDEAGMTALAQSIADADALRLEANREGPAATKGLRVMLRGEDVSLAIRTPAISMGASRVSAIPGVRQALLAMQRNAAKHGPIVAEGRDIGTVVFPDALVKFFLTASLEIRAQRRLDELASKGDSQTLQEVMTEVRQRDRQDSERPVAPLRQAEDAALIDSSGKSINAIVDQLFAAVHDALA